METDPEPINNFAPQTTVSSEPPPPPPPSSIDLSATLTDDIDPIEVGGTVTYSVVVTNLSLQDTATGINMHFEIFWDVGGTPPEVLSSTPTQGDPCTTGELPAGDLPPIRTVDCFLGTLGPGAVAGATIQVLASQVGSILSDVEITLVESDPDPVNNFAPQTTTVVSPPPPPPADVDLAVTKTGDPETAIVGDAVTYTITVTNLGTDTATGVVLADEVFWALSNSIPDITSAVPGQGTCVIGPAITPRICGLRPGRPGPGR